MKKIIPIMVLAALCLNFNAKAQAPPTNITALKIGDKVPDITISNIINYKGAGGKPATTAKISDFKGKLLILDFWATWCSPCVAMIPKMDSLQKELGDKVQFLSVTYQPEKDVLTFLERYEKQQGKHYNLPIVTDEKPLHQLFPHIYLPHYVWIDKYGNIKAFTEFKDVNATNITSTISEKPLNLKVKQDGFRVPYSKDKLLFAGNNGGDGETIIAHSVLSGYTDGLSGGFSFRNDSIKGCKITCRNLTILGLYRTAFSEFGIFGRNRTIINVRDSTKLISNFKGQDYLTWLKNNNGFCYELLLPPSLANKAYSTMRKDLDLFFNNYFVRLDNRETMCIALVRTTPRDLIHSKGGKSVSEFTPFGFHLKNFPLARITAQLNFLYLQNSPFPVIDETGYSDWVDIDVQANLSDINAMNKELERYGLKFVEKSKTIPMMVISDR